MKHKGLNQLLCAAVVNERFREVLLHHPARAIAMGYCDQSFSLTAEERDLVLGIHARQLEDFAAQVYGWISGNGRQGGANGTSRSNRSGYGHAPRDYAELTADFVRVPVPA